MRSWPPALRTILLQRARWLWGRRGSPVIWPERGPRMVGIEHGGLERVACAAGSTAKRKSAHPFLRRKDEGVPSHSTIAPKHKTPAIGSLWGNGQRTHNEGKPIMYIPYRETIHIGQTILLCRQREEGQRKWAPRSKEVYQRSGAPAGSPMPLLGYRRERSPTILQKPCII